jgi:hypothetical protein
MNYILLAIIIIIILFVCSIQNENFGVYHQNYDPYLLYTYELTDYPSYIAPYLKNTTLLQLSEPADQTWSTICKNCSHLGKEKCGLCRNCGWCIDKKGKGQCVPGDGKGPHLHADCEIWRHPYKFGRFKPRFSGRIFNKDATY